MPSKALLRPAEVLAEVARIPGAAEAVTGKLVPQAVLDRRDEVIHDLDDSVQLPWLEDRGIALYRGRGRLVGERRVRVGDEEIEARRAVMLAGGTLPALPPIPGLDRFEPWTNRDATTTKRVPERLVIVGGGVVGSEMSQAFQSLGAKVTLVEGERRLLPREEEFACAQVTEALEGHGVDIRTGQKAERFERGGDGTITVTVGDGSTAVGDQVLVALGRTPQTEQLGLEDLGFPAGEYVETDENLAVPGHPWLYAIGDVNGRALFTHMGKYQARVACDHLLGKPSATAHGADGALSPRLIFTDPQVGAVGHTTDTARAAGLEVTVIDAPTSGNAGGSFYGRNAPGTARFLVDERRRVLVGATITGSEAVDFLHAATIAVVGEVPLERLRHAVPAFPTRSEIWLKLLEGAGL
jgi:dihydrolipoamide dehydrogenase